MAGRAALTERFFERLAGVAGLVFVAGVALQNGVLLSGSPMPDAGLDEIRDFYASGETPIAIGVGLVALNILCLLLFTSGVAGRLARDGAGLVARSGFGAAVLLAGAFLTTTAIQAVLTAGVGELADAGLLQVVWDLHSAAFAMSASSLAALLAMFSLGAWSTRAVVPTWVAALGFVGAVSLLVAGMSVVSTIDGGPGVLFQLIGFVAWLVFLIAASVRLMRGDPAEAAAAEP